MAIVQLILDCFIQHFKLQYKHSNNITKSCVNTFVVKLNQGEERLSAISGTPESMFVLTCEGGKKLNIWKFC